MNAQDRDRQAGRQTDRQIDRYQIQTDMHRETEAERQTKNLC